MTRDEEHLRLLSIFDYVLAGLAGGLSAFYALPHLILGLFFILAPENLAAEGQPPVPFIGVSFIGWSFVILAAVFITVGWVFAAFVFTAGRCLARRRRYSFCLVIAAIECVFIPFGTALGVFTIIVLERESVKRLFASNDAIQPSTTRSAASGG